MLDYRQNRLRLGIAFVICFCLVYTAGFGVYRLREKAVAARAPGPRDARVFWEAWRRVERHFFGDLPSPKARTYAAIRRSLTLLDPYTVFVEPVSRELEQDQLRGSYGGIGVDVWRDAQGRFVLAPYPDSPAQRVGLSRGDLLVAIDGQPVREALTESDVEAILHGEVGTPVRLTVQRAQPSGEVTLEIEVEREKIDVPSVTWHLEGAHTGYVHLLRFTERTGDELSDALEALSRAGAANLVLDLRENRGGLLESSVAVAGQFLNHGDVVLYQEGRSGQRTFRARGGGDVETPLAVLVDGGTASAAEIVAGALQDNGRAPLIGQPTFGKGSVQEIYHLSDGSSLHVTTAIWITPDRHRIDKKGLTPDRLVPDSDDGVDQALSQALTYLGSE